MQPLLHLDAALTSFGCRSLFHLDAAVTSFVGSPYFIWCHGGGSNKTLLAIGRTVYVAYVDCGVFSIKYHKTASVCVSDRYSTFLTPTDVWPA